MKTRRAEVAGAGLAGLTVAAVLAQRGWNVRVHERAPELREIGAGIYLFENALRVLEEIGAYDHVAARAERILDGDLRDHADRLVIRRNERREVASRLFVAVRGDLHAALALAATRAGAEIVTGSQVLAATPDGRLEFEDGLGERADLVVGADGVRSRVRDSLALATSITDLQDGCGRHLIARVADDPVQRTIEVWNGGRRLGIAPAAREWVYIFLCCPSSDVGGRRQQPFDTGEWIRTHPAYASQLGRIPRHPEGRWLTFYDVRCRAWSEGRVALVGDAAHAMSPNLGQGACTAMSNALALGQAVSVHADIPAALLAWEASERPLTDRTQRYSYLYGRIGTRWPRAVLDVRSRLVPVVARNGRFRRAMSQASEHFPDLDAARAVPDA
ncbi:MAG TPA: NAD(P)/FAD-dependent oxidoreductase [Gaiellales bacterium]|nr:NAD(P)/FAD-dependent oxidoreductase [Gaiellales bacterium]